MDFFGFYGDVIKFIFNIIIMFIKICPQLKICRIATALLNSN